ncbi:hypothetical protein BHF71_10405 [Vulcanibacillus modesticaldus]|uniref:Alpha-amylase SusG-like C-terminal domain-containing protein n=1 Tax=Vulcanibacillus modesticaldus TaxID=337097 RepID=A0A1D2YTL1_9BACI|nr:hypothetical protein BHF71_10405 [Vulcanibacillus modesticaldus]
MVNILTISGIIAFKRTLDQDSLLVIHNLTGEQKSIILTDQESEFKNILFSTGNLVKINNNKAKIELQITPYTTVILGK